MMRSLLLCACAVLAWPVHAADLVVSDAWIRYISSLTPAAGYFTVKNLSDAPVSLIGAASPTFHDVMLHKSMMTSGMAKMEPVSKVEVPAHGELKFSPGGYHLMLMNAPRKLAVGDRIPITLQFAGGQTVTAEFAVRSASAQ